MSGICSTVSEIFQTHGSGLGPVNPLQHLQMSIDCRGPLFPFSCDLIKKANPVKNRSVADAKPETRRLSGTEA